MKLRNTRLRHRGTVGLLAGESMAELVERWSSALIRTRTHTRRSWIPQRVLQTGSVLVEPATKEQIAGAEARLGIRLPPSYKEFLAVTNGAFGSESLQIPFNSDGLRSVEDIGWCSQDHNMASLIDIATEGGGVEAFGQSTLHSVGWIEADYISAPARGKETELEMKDGQMYWSVLVGSADVSQFIVLNPMIADASGEWEAVSYGKAMYSVRHASFRHWLENSVSRLEAEVPSEAELWDRARHGETLFARLFALGDLVAVSDDPEPVAAEIESVFEDPTAYHHSHERALRLLGWLDRSDGGGRAARQTWRFLTDRAFDDVPLLMLITGDLDDLGGMPSPSEVWARTRPGDIARLAEVPDDVVGRLFEDHGARDLRDELERRGHPLVADHHRAILWELSQLAGFGSRSNEALPGGRHVPREDVVEALANVDESTARRHAGAVGRAGYPDLAVALLETQLDGMGGQSWIGEIARYDDPAAWESLDRATASPRFTEVALLLAARTSSPLLPPRAAAFLDDDNMRHRLIAVTALEVHPTQLAADTLLDAWRNNDDYAALRALARRRDNRIRDDCLALLAGSDPDLRRVGADTLRDLRDDDTKDVLLDALRARGDEEFLIVLAHTLAMLRVREAVPLLREIANEQSDRVNADLLNLWADQLI